LKYLLLTKK